MSSQPATPKELAGLRHQLVGPGRGLAKARVIEALLRVPRHEFIPDELRSLAYADRALSIGYGQTISQPFIVGFMTAMIDPRPEERMLEIGTGCGYQTAVLASLAGEVFTIETVPALAESASVTLQRLGFHNVRQRVGSGWDGWPDAAPFDAIVVTCAPGEVPQPLLAQLRVGGRLIIPVGKRDAGQTLWFIQRTETGYDRKPVMDVRFVPMIR